MRKQRVKKIAGITLVTFLALTTVLVIHIWWVTRPRVDASTRVMARIDIHQPIDQTAASTITGWLYAQNGVDRVMCNPSTGIAVFTYSPLKADANAIAARFSKELPYHNASRFVPTEDQMKNGCPVSPNSFTYRAYTYLKQAIN